MAYCEQDGGIGWRLRYYVDAGKRKCRLIYSTSIRNKNVGFSSISIENEDVEYVLDLEEPELFF